MTYTYPPHFKHPDTEIVFFADHVQLWEEIFGFMKTKPNVCLEIGALYGGPSVYILEEFCKMEGSHHYIMDINSNEYIEVNLYPYRDKVTYLKGESADHFKKFEHFGESKEFLDFVYIDGNHTSKYVLEDAVNSFYCLKNNGIMIFDDFGGGLEQEPHLQVKTAVDSFINSYHKYLNVVYVGYQIIIQKIEYINKEELNVNYDMGQKQKNLKVKYSDFQTKKKIL
jgi:cephalosporin hydroxylase